MDEIRKIAGPVRVKLSELYYQYIPIVTSEPIWDNDMSLRNSPHVQLVRIMMWMQNGGGLLWEEIVKSRYYQDRLFRMSKGAGSEEYIRKKILSRYRLLKKIRKIGFNDRASDKSPIIVLNKPFWQTRFNYQRPCPGMEIWDGGGRCAIAYVLDKQTVPAYIYEDAAPGTCKSEKFEKKLSGVKGLFDGINNNPQL
jgi:hypothetical protein